jgi:hypothetical protein
MNELIVKKLVGLPTVKPNYSSFELETRCELCGAIVWITMGARFAKVRLKAHGYACFDCLSKSPEYIARK